MAAIPYCGPSPAPEGIAWAWNLDPFLIIVLAAATWFLRAEPLRAKLGLVIIVVAYVSPLCALSAGLFSARSIHHLLIVFGAAPLLAGMLRATGVSLNSALLVNVLVFWAWHIPPVYAWALSSDAAYWLGQVVLLGSSLLFWSAIERQHTSAPAAFLALIAMVIQMGLLGALITFANVPLYGPHFLTTQQYGLSPLEDQQLAGLIMWVASLPLTVASGWAVLRRWLPTPIREATP